MKKSIDFSNGVRGKHVGKDLKVLGGGDVAWAVCVSANATDLISFKLYRIERFAGSDDVRVLNERGEVSYYPSSWFARVEVPLQTQGILEKSV